jgi:hypothetical protein
MSNYDYPNQIFNTLTLAIVEMISSLNLRLSVSQIIAQEYYTIRNLYAKATKTFLLYQAIGL